MWARYILVVVVAIQGIGLLAAPVSRASATIEFGAAPGGGGDSRIEELNKLEGQLDRQLDFVRVFELWDSPFPTVYHDLLQDSGHKMLLSVRAKRQDGSFVPWRDIADAQPGTQTHDEMLAWVTRVGDLGVPVWFSFNHEPEIVENFANGTDQDFIDAWQRIIDEFTAQAVTNAEFVWIMTDYSFRVPDTDWRYAPNWYPGDAYVDLMAADAYNYSDCRPLEPITWRPLVDSIDGLREFGLSHPDKELILAEWASTEMAGDGGAAKAAWIDEAHQLLQQPGWEQFVAISYFNQEDPGHPDCAWEVDSTPTALDALRAMADDPFYGGAASPPGGVVFVAGNPNSLSAGESAVIGRLQSSGYDVDVVDDDGTTAAAAAGKDLAIISSSTANTFLTATTFRWVPTPVWVSKPWLLDDYGMTGLVGGTDYGSQLASQMTVIDEIHPLAAGLTGDVTVTSSARSTQFGVPAGQASTVATAAGLASIFVYEAGDQLADGSIGEGCRIAFSIFQNAPTAFTLDGWALFDAAADYAVGGCGSATTNNPPTVSFTSPSEGETVSATVVVTVDALDPDGMAQVEFLADGESFGADTNGADGWSMPWNTSASSEGPVILTAVATDLLGGSATDTVSVTVDHGAPTVSLSSPGEGAIVSSVVTITADAADPDGVDQVEFFVDGVSVGLDLDGGDGWSLSWDSAEAPDGSTSLSVTATDSLGASATHAIVINVDNEPPMVSITTPADGATVAGSVLVTATATDVVGVAQVEFFADGSTVGIDADGTDGWSATWDTAAGPDGVVPLSAMATDLNDATDTHTISVSVDNSGSGSIVVLVVGNPASLSAGDQAVVGQLESKGSVVSVVDDDTATAATATGVDLLIISSSANSNVIGSTFTTVTTPVLVSKPWLLDNMAMTGAVSGTDYGIVPASQGVISEPTHPLAAGLTGTVTVTTASRNTQFGLPGGDGTVVSTAAGLPAIFVFDPGQQLTDGTTAAGCRIAFSIYQNAATVFTTDGWALFDAAVGYATSGCVPVAPNDPPAVSIINPVDGSSVSGSITITADASDSDGVDQVEFFAAGVSLGVDNDGGDGWSIAWDTTALPEGLTSINATATDSLGATNSHTISVTIDNTSDLLITLVVGNPGSLSGGDAAVVARLEAAGYVVTIVDDDDATAETATGADLVIISSTANSNVLGSTFKTVTAPVWVSKPWLLDNMAMTGTSGLDYGTTSSTQLTITDPGHPLAAGLAGTVTVTTKPRSTQIGIPGGEGSVVATTSGEPTIFVYQAGQLLADTSAATGCRLAFSIYQNAATVFTTEAWELFDSAVGYASNGCTAP